MVEVIVVVVHFSNGELWSDNLYLCFGGALLHFRLQKKVSESGRPTTSDSLLIPFSCTFEALLFRRAISWSAQRALPVFSSFVPGTTERTALG
jgi:hypothetical protein